MKTLLVLSALAAIATASPALPSDDITDLEVAKNEKRSPTFSHVAAPIHPLPVVHHTYVQPVIPHHLGLKKPLLFKHHGHHLYRSDDEQVETHSAESKESKNKCMKEMKAKCGDDLAAKSSELPDGTNIEDIDEDITETDVAQSLMMAKEAVNTLQKKLQKAEKNSKMTQWKQVELESDVKLHENVETAKQALDHMQLNFGNLESMNVHATTFKDAAVHDVHLQLAGSEQERLTQWKDAIENIQKNVELAKNIEDSFQKNENSEMQNEKSSSFTKAKSEDLKSSLDSKRLKEENISSKSASEMQMEGKSTELKSSWKPMEFERSANIELSNLNNDMASSATSLSGSKAILDGVNEHHDKSSRSESSQSKLIHLKEHHDINHNNEKLLHQRDSGIASTQFGLSSTINTEQIADNESTKKLRDGEDSIKITEEMITKPMEPASSLIKALKSSESVDMKLTKLKDEKSSPIVDTTTLMKSVDQQSQSDLISHPEGQEKNAEPKRTEEETESNTHTDISKSPEFDTTKATVGKSLDISLGSGLKGAQSEMSMKSPDQTTGQSQQTEVAVKAVQTVAPVLHSETSSLQTLVSTQGKSVEGDSSSLSNIGLNAGFKSSLDVPKTMTWKEAPRHGASRGTYGSGVALGGYGGAGYSSGAGAGSGAVGVFPNARVGGCAIPLLLSCSPSVVAGSLAKAHHASYATPSYAAPSYRGSENTVTHTKRDITKIGFPSKRRTPIKNYKQKTIFNTDRL